MCNMVAELAMRGQQTTDSIASLLPRHKELSTVLSLLLSLSFVRVEVTKRPSISMCGLMLIPFSELLAVAIIADVETEARPSSAGYPLASGWVDWLPPVHLIHANACKAHARVPCGILVQPRIPRPLLWLRDLERVSRLFWSNDFLVFSPLFFLFYSTDLLFIRYGLSTVGYSFVSYTHLPFCLVCRFLAIFAILEASCAHHRSLSTLFDHTASFSPQMSPSDQRTFTL